MDIKYQTNTVKLLLSMADKNSVTKPIIEYTPQKKRIIDSKPDEGEIFLERCKPTDVGISQKRVSNYFSLLDSDHSIMAHTIMLIKDGKVFAEKDYAPYNHENWHISYSLCKTITGLAIGFMVDEGVLDLNDRIFKIFEKNLSITSNIKSYKTTVRDVLTMQTGILFNEVGSVTEDNWTNAMLSSQLIFEPGKGFMYNSMNTYLLAAIVKKITGMGLVDYLRPRLFEPLGIQRYLWEKSPEGIEKGGWGLYIRPEDMAKLGILFMNGGKFNNKQIISEKWIAIAMQKQAEVPLCISRYSYGYQMWTSHNPRLAAFNGLFGQNIVIYPDSGVVAVITAGNSDMFHQNNFFEYTSSYWGFERLLKTEDVVIDDSVLQHPDETSRYRMEFKMPSTPVPQNIKGYLGRRFRFEDTRARSIGVLPVILQSFQNNFSKGLTEMALTEENGQMIVKIKEVDEEYILPFTFNGYCYSVLDYHGEKYTIATEVVMTKNEDYVPVMKLRIFFTETASVRYIKLFFYNDHIKTYWSETPGMDMIYKGIDMVKNYVKLNKILAGMIDRIKLDYFINRTINVFEPVADAIEINEKQLISENILQSRSK